MKEDIDKLNPDEVKELFGSEPKVLSFRERQDLKNGKPGISDEIQLKYESALEENNKLTEELETQKMIHASANQQHDESTNELNDKIQTLTNENLELGAKLKHSELMLSELKQIQKEEKKLADQTESKEDKVPEKNPNPRRK